MRIPNSSRLFLISMLIIVSLLFSACRAATETPTPLLPTEPSIPPTATPIPPTQTPTPIPPTNTPIPPTATPIPPPIVGVFINDVSQPAQPAVNFVQFYPDGKVTYVLIQLDPGQTSTINSLYDKYAKELLKPDTPPGKTGTYTFDHDQVNVEFPNDSFPFGTSGIYQDGVITFDGSSQPNVFGPLPLGIQSTWYLDRSADGKMLYDYLQFFPDGTLSAVQINNDAPPDPLPNAFDIYNTQAQALLVENPSRPATSGTYLLQNDNITINWDSGTPATKAEGTYTPEKISVTTSKDELLEYQPLPILLDTTFYLNTSTGKQTGYAYLKFYPDLTVSYVEIRLDPPQTGSAREVYDTIAEPRLQPLSPPPSSSGFYIISGDQIKIIFPGGYPFTESVGKYTKNKITVQGSENKSFDYAPLSLAP
jgi:hypothetical protein